MEIESDSHIIGQKQGAAVTSAVVSSSRQLVATGTLQSVDPDRIILKRVILTGKRLYCSCMPTCTRGMRPTVPKERKAVYNFIQWPRHSL